MISENIKSSSLKSLLALATVASASVAQAQTHVIFVTIDDLSRGSLGIHGCPVPDISPNLDALGYAGLRFEHAHVAAANCTPSRNAMVSGMYSHNNMVLSVGGEGSGNHATYPTLPDVFNEAGYHTGTMGKNSHQQPFFPYAGWDVEYDGYGSTRDPENVYDKLHSAFTNSAALGEPLFFNLNIYDPHVGWYKWDQKAGIPSTSIEVEPSRVYTASEVPYPTIFPPLSAAERVFTNGGPYGIMDEVAAYYNTVKRADDTIGRMMDCIADHGAMSNTIVVVVADHGVELAGGKTQLYNESSVSPLFVLWPGVTTSNSVDSTHMINSIDILPTFCELVGQPIPANIDGKSFLPIIRGQEPAEWREFIYKQHSVGHNMRAVQTTNLLYIFNPWSDGVNVPSTVTKNHQSWFALEAAAQSGTNLAATAWVEHFEHRTVEELYDITTDPDCKINLVTNAAYAAQLAGLQAIMEQEMIDSGDDEILVAFQDRGNAATLAQYIDDDDAMRDVMSDTPERTRDVFYNPHDDWEKIGHTIFEPAGEWGMWTPEGNGIVLNTGMGDGDSGKNCVEFDGSETNISRLVLTNTLDTSAFTQLNVDLILVESAALINGASVAVQYNDGAGWQTIQTLTGKGEKNVHFELGGGGLPNAMQLGILADLNGTGGSIYMDHVRVTAWQEWASAPTNAAFDATDLAHVRLAFDFETLNFTDTDKLLLEMYNGSAWEPLAEYDYNYTLQTNQSYSDIIDLYPSTQSFATNMEFRFRSESTGSGQSFTVDHYTIDTRTASLDVAPTTFGDAYTVIETNLLSVAAPGVLANDVSGNGAALTGTVVSDVSHGILNFNSDGSFTYVATNNYRGTDSFTYRAEDGGILGAAATVTLSVEDAPPVRGTVIFGLEGDLNWKALGFLDNSSTSNSASITTNGVTFTVTAVTSGNLDSNVDGDMWGVNAGFANTQIDYGVGAGSGEAVTFTLAVSGETLSSLSLDNLDLIYFNNSYERTLASDGDSHSVTLIGGGAGDAVDYGTELNGLTALTAANVATWELSLEALEADPATEVSGFGIGTMSFDYVIASVSETPEAPVANADAYELDMDEIFTNAAPGVLSNDSDGNMDAITASLVTSPTNGTLLQFSSAGSFVYQPNAGVTGIDTFTYEAIDVGGLTSGVATVTLTVVAPPSSISGTVTFGDEDLALNVDWKTYGFTDNNSTVNTAVITQDGVTFSLTAATSANLDLNGDGDLWGVRGGGNNTRVDDGNTPEETVTFTLAVSGDPLSDLSFNGMALRYFGNSYEQIDLSDGTTTLPTLAGGAATGWVDYDTELNGLTALTAGNVATWQLTMAAVDSLDPVSGGTDFGFTEIAFDYTTGVSAPEAPVTVADSYELDSDIVFTNAAPGVLANDTDADGDALTAGLVSTTTNGTLVLAPDGSFTYQPDTDYVGIDTFTYEAIDAGGLTGNVATVTLTVGTQEPASGTVTFGTLGAANWLALGFTDNQSAVNTASITTNGVTFTVTATTSGELNSNLDGTLWGVHGGSFATQLDENSGAQETVTFTFAVSGELLSTLSLANLDLTYFNNSYEQASAGDGTTTLTLTGGGDGDAVDYATELAGLTELTAANVATWQLTVSTLDANPTNELSAFGIGTMSFDYALDPGPLAPEATADSYEVEADMIFTNAAPGVLANDTDANGDALTASLVSSPSEGTLVEFLADGSFIYQPDPGFTGTDSFTYEAIDAGGLTSSVVAVSLSVSNTPVTLPLVFQSNMVLQRDKPIVVWGWGAPGKAVEVSLSSGQTNSAVVDSNGRWQTSLTSMAATNGPLTLVVTSPGSSVTLTNLAVGDVWFCSGQSNAGWSLSSTDGADEEIAAANNPNFRLIRVPRIAMAAPSDDPLPLEDALGWDSETGSLIDKAGKWFVCSPDTAGYFGAVFYYTGKEIQTTLDIPIGIIQSAYAGTPMEAWSKSVLPEAHPNEVEAVDAHSLYNGMVYPYLKLPITGVCWYQGERNYLDRFVYTEKLAIEIDDWRTAWGQLDLPWYYIRIPPVFQWNTVAEADPNLPYLYEAQAKVMDVVPNTYMVDISDTSDGELHPHNKAPVGQRMGVRILKNTYGFTSLVDSGPLFNHAEAEGSTLRLYFDEVAAGLAMNTNIGYNANGDEQIDVYEDTNGNHILDDGEDMDKDEKLDTGEDLNNNGILDSGEDIDGDGILDYSEWDIQFPSFTWFELLNSDGTFTSATAVIDGATVVLSAPSVTEPIGFRYAWSRMAQGKLMNSEGLPARVCRLTPPLAQSESYELEMNTEIYLPPAGILANDVFASSILPIERPIVISNVSNGTLMLRSDGAFLYEPNTGFTGVDQFTYVASDGVEVSPEVTVTLTVLASIPETGSLSRDVWTGVLGYLVSDLTGLPDYPDHPDEIGSITSLEAPSDWGDNYGQRLYGYLHPPTNGTYNFYISSAARSELWISTDEDPANLVRDCTSLSRDPGVWATNGTPIALVGGQRYFIEVLHKENSGFDHVEVAWDLAGAGTTNIIDGVYLSEVPREIPVTTDYESWSSWYGVSGDEYLVDFSFNMDPTTVYTPVMVPATGTVGLPYWQVSTPSGFAVEYLRRKNVPGLTYAVQFTDSLLSPWIDSEALEFVSPINGTWERVSVIDEVSIADATNRFGRVFITQD